MFCDIAASEKPFLKDSVTFAATQEACSCFRRQIFTKQQAKKNVSLHRNKIGGKQVWTYCCVCVCTHACMCVPMRFGIDRGETLFSNNDNMLI